jgi:hypothetical protein
VSAKHLGVDLAASIPSILNPQGEKLYQNITRVYVKRLYRFLESRNAWNFRQCITELLLALLLETFTLKFLYFLLWFFL